MLQSRSLRAIAVAFTLILFVCLAWAQSDSGSISGFVRDPSGAVVPNARVTVTNASGIERSTATNESGYYTITNLPPGMYTLRVEARGFKRYETSGNKLDPSSNLAIDASLTIGAATETVEVSATAVALQSESASVQNLITRQQIDLLELNGRNPVGQSIHVHGVPMTIIGTIAPKGRVLGQSFDGTAQKGSDLPILYDEFGVESEIPPEKTSL